MDGCQIDCLGEIQCGKGAAAVVGRSESILRDGGDLLTVYFSWYNQTDILFLVLRQAVYVIRVQLLNRASRNYIIPWGGNWVGGGIGGHPGHGADAGAGFRL